jgi:hypothetical protein
VKLSFGAILGGIVSVIIVLAALITLDRDPKGFILVVFLGAILFTGTYVFAKLKERKN